MKRMIAGILALCICLSLCACAGGEKQAQAAGADEDSVIEFEAPVVVAEDEYVRVELLRFYEEYYVWSDFGGVHGTPEKADPSMEGSAAEKLVVFKFYNKCDHRLRLYMDNIYLGDDGATLYLMAAKVNPEAGKNVTAPYLIRTGETETLESLETLYTFEGEFLVKHEYDDGTQKNPHTLKFSIPAAFAEK